MDKPKEVSRIISDDGKWVNIHYDDGGEVVEPIDNTYTCPNCNTQRINPFPVSDETGDTYCPDCNWSIDLKD